MEHKKISFSFKVASATGLLAAVMGGLVSAALILEYFGISIGLSDAVCRAGSGVNACRNVAKSSLAAIRSLPLVGDIPTALFGFIYYFYTALLFGSSLRNRSGKNPLILALILAIIAMAADLFLFLISALFIGAFCPLCTVSYVATIIVLAASILGLLKYRSEKEAKPLRPSFVSYMRGSIPKHGTALFLITAIGLGITLGARFSLAEAMARFGGDERALGLIEQYEEALEVRLKVEGAPFEGRPGAPVKIVVFSDFNCSSCIRMEKTLKRLLEENPYKWIVYYKNFPLGEQCEDPTDYRRELSSCLAARAALCAGRQGRYFDYASALYLDCETGIEHDILSLKGHALRLGLDGAAFDLCMSSRDALEMVRRDYLEGEGLMVDGTPTVFVNDRMLDTHMLDLRTLRALTEYISTK